jgi:hypothetical protein
MDVTEREKELRQKIAAKQREQYLATRDIINKAEARVRDTDRQLKIGDPSHSTKIRLKADLDMYSRNRDVIYGIADRNRRIYEYEIDCIHDEIKLLHETDVERIRFINVESKRKTAYYQLIGDYTGTPSDVWRHIYQRIPSPTGEYQMGLLERARTHMRDAALSEYELDNIIKIYRRVLYLFDLGFKEFIMDFYSLLETLPVLPKNGPIAEFVDRCNAMYLIPDKLRRYRLRAKMFTQLPLCEDVVCEIFSYLNDEKLCTRKMIDSVVYLE